MDRDTYRAYRGIVRHVLPRLRRWSWTVGSGIRRATSVTPAGYGRNTTGRCCWCGLILDEKRQVWWHRECRRYYYMLSGAREAYGDLAIPLADCPCGQGGVELDHRVPIGLAALRGPRAFVRAFLPANLQWLCALCHKAKTAQDKRDIADCKAGRIRMRL